MHLYPAETWRRHFSTLDRVLFFLAAAGAIAFMVLRPRAPYAGDWLLKSIPIIYLGLLILKHVQGRTGIFLALGFFFSAGGDIALEFKIFQLGLGLFLVAHVFYILVFRRDFVYDSMWTPATALLGAYGLGMAVLLIPYLGGLLIHVMVYMLVLIGMGIFALYRQGRSKLPFYGALFFIGSDSLIALNKFLPPADASASLIMPTYYIAQFMIAAGFLFEPVFLAED